MSYKHVMDESRLDPKVVHGLHYLTLHYFFWDLLSFAKMGFVFSIQMRVSQDLNGNCNSLLEEPSHPLLSVD